MTDSKSGISLSLWNVFYTVFMALSIPRALTPPPLGICQVFYNFSYSQGWGICSNRSAQGGDNGQGIVICQITFFTKNLRLSLFILIFLVVPNTKRYKNWVDKHHFSPAFLKWTEAPSLPHMSKYLQCFLKKRSKQERDVQKSKEKRKNC